MTMYLNFSPPTISTLIYGSLLMVQIDCLTSSLLMPSSKMKERQKKHTLERVHEGNLHLHLLKKTQSQAYMKLQGKKGYVIFQLAAMCPDKNRFCYSMQGKAGHLLGNYTEQCYGNPVSHSIPELLQIKAQGLPQ